MKLIALRIQESVYDILKEIAKEENTTMSELIRTAIIDFINKTNSK